MTSLKEECTGRNWNTRLFNWADYLVFGATLFVSLGIGVFYGFFAKTKQNTTAEFLMGSKRLNYFALGVSLTVGYASAIGILGNASEMYNYGTQYAAVLIAFVIMVPLTVNLFLPVMRELQITSIYEYLDRRFSNGARLLVSLLNFFMMLMYISVVVYAPALALKQVTGIGTYTAVGLIFLVAITYSSLGGLKAVVWSDVFLFSVIMASIIMVIVRGTMADGGPISIWQNAYDSGRIEFFRMDPNPLIRHTFWTTVIGSTFYWVGMNGATQNSMQRLLSVKTQREALKSMCLSGLGMCLIYVPTFYMGLMMYTHFMHCDPLLSKAVNAPDQILPLYVMDVAGEVPGLPGLFVAGVFSASLSTVGSALNATAASMLRDLLGGGLGYRPPDERAALVTRCMCGLFGVLSFSLTFLVAELGGVLQICISFNGMAIGVILGIFVLGMWVPWSNTKGMLTGSLCTLAIILWIGFGAQIAIMKRELVHSRKPVGITDCECDIIIPAYPELKEVFGAYRISYMYYPTIGCLLTVVFGTVSSLLWDGQSVDNIDPMLLAPVVRRWFIKKHRTVNIVSLDIAHNL